MVLKWAHSDTENAVSKVLGKGHWGPRAWGLSSDVGAGGQPQAAGTDLGLGGRAVLVSRSEVRERR